MYMYMYIHVFEYMYMYSAEELVGVFNQQCERDAVRLGSTVTQVILLPSDSGG